jgi:hypothetical protein
MRTLAEGELGNFVGLKMIKPVDAERRIQLAMSSPADILEDQATYIPSVFPHLVAFARKVAGIPASGGPAAHGGGGGASGGGGGGATTPSSVLNLDDDDDEEDDEDEEDIEEYDTLLHNCVDHINPVSWCFLVVLCCWCFRLAMS